MGELRGAGAPTLTIQLHLILVKFGPYGRHGLVVRTSASQAEGPGFDPRVARLLYWTRSYHHPTVPLHPGVKLGSSYKTDGNCIGRKNYWRE